MPSSDAAFDVVVVGGIVVDSVFQASRPTTTVSDMVATSTPSRLTRRAAGGVGRNIAEALGRLGCRVALASVVGDDDAGRAAVRSARAAGVDVRFVRTVPAGGASTATYTALLDGRGELAAASADMGIFDAQLTPPNISAELLAAIMAARFLVLDGNVPAEAIAMLARAVKQRGDGGAGPQIAFDPISREKCQRVLPVLRMIDVIKPNEHEVTALASAVSGPAILPSRLAPAAAARIVARAGVRTVLCTTGATGCVVATMPAAAAAAGALAEPEIVVVPAVPLAAGELKKVTGAGDSFLAGFLFGALRGLPPVAAAECGARAAALTLRSDDVVSREIAPATVLPAALSKL